MQRTQQDADDDVSAQLFCSKWGWRVLGLFLTHTDTAIYHSAPRPAAHVRATINKSTNPQHLTLCGPHVDYFYCKLNVNIIRERTCMLACGRLRMNANVREHIAKAQCRTGNKFARSQQHHHPIEILYTRYMRLRKNADHKSCIFIEWVWVKCLCLCTCEDKFACQCLGF